MLTFKDLRNNSSEYILGNGENTGNKHFFSFPKMFWLLPQKTAILSLTEIIICKMVTIWARLTFCCLVKG